MDMNPNHDSILIRIMHGPHFDTVHSIPREKVSYPYLPVVAEAMEDISIKEMVIARGTLVEFSGVGDNDSLRQVQLLNGALAFPARIEEHLGQWHVLPYDSIGVIEGPVGELQRGGVLRINDANRDWVVSFSELRRKQ